MHPAHQTQHGPYRCWGHCNPTQAASGAGASWMCFNFSVSKVMEPQWPSGFVPGLATQGSGVRFPVRTDEIFMIKVSNLGHSKITSTSQKTSRHNPHVHTTIHYENISNFASHLFHTTFFEMKIFCHLQHITLSLYVSHNNSSRQLSQYMGFCWN